MPRPLLTHIVNAKTQMDLNHAIAHHNLQPQFLFIHHSYQWVHQIAHAIMWQIKLEAINYVLAALVHHWCLLKIQSVPPVEAPISNANAPMFTILRLRLTLIHVIVPTKKMMEAPQISNHKQQIQAFAIVLTWLMVLITWTVHAVCLNMSRLSANN